MWVRNECYNVRIQTLMLWERDSHPDLFRRYWKRNKRNESSIYCFCDVLREFFHKIHKMISQNVLWSLWHVHCLQLCFQNRRWYSRHLVHQRRVFKPQKCYWVMVRTGWKSAKLNGQGTKVLQVWIWTRMLYHRLRYLNVTEMMVISNFDFQLVAT